MEELKSLISLVNRNKIKQIEIIGIDEKSASKAAQLYNLIASGKVDNEQEAMDILYGQFERKNFYFNRVKNKLKDRLINTIFFIDVNQSNFTEYQKAYYSSVRIESAIKILIAQSLRQPAIKLSERILKKAIKFELTDTVLYLVRNLKRHYGGIVGNKRKYTDYSELVDHYLELQKAETLAEGFYSDIMLYCVKSRESKKDVAIKAKEYSANLSVATEGFDSYRLKLYSFMVHALAFEIADDFPNAIIVYKEALDYFHRKKHIATPNIRIAYLLRILACHVRLKEFDSAKDVAESYLKLVPEGSLNWYVALQYYLISAFQLFEFGLAYDIVKKALGHNGFKKLYQNHTEQWYLYEGFIKYFLEIGKIPLTVNEKSIKFRINKFLNDVPIYSKDKRGSNITILILQILFLLQQRKYGEIIDRVESIKMYAHRYLRKGSEFRSDCFIKMLIQLPACSFHKAAVIRKASRFQQLLLNSSSDLTVSNPEVEIVPYEYLWDCILESLQNKHYRG